MNGDGGVVDGGHQGRESRAAGMMPIFVPPTVFGEMEGADRKDRKRGQVQLLSDYAASSLRGASAAKHGQSA